MGLFKPRKPEPVNHTRKTFSARQDDMGFDFEPDDGDKIQDMINRYTELGEKWGFDSKFVVDYGRCGDSDSIWLVTEPRTETEEEYNTRIENEELLQVQYKENLVKYEAAHLLELEEKAIKLNSEIEALRRSTWGKNYL